MKPEVNDNSSYGNIKVERLGDTVSSKPALYAIGAIGGSILLLGLLSAPFLVVPASRKLGSLPWMVCIMCLCLMNTMVDIILILGYP